MICAALLLGTAAGAQASILGEDNRQADRGQEPWSNAVGFVMRADGKNGVLSGIGSTFLVGPRVILTNYHNLFTDDGAFQPGAWVYVPEGDERGRKVKILDYFQFTPVSKASLPLGARTRGQDVIALILAEPVDYAPLTLAPLAASDRSASNIGPARYAMAGVALTFDYADGVHDATFRPRTVGMLASYLY